MAEQTQQKVPDAAPAVGGGSDEDNSQSVEAYRRWLRLWSSLIQSTIHGCRTAFPYSHYLKKLKLNDLNDLLHDPKFTDRVSKSFFEGYMKDFRRMKILTATTKKATARLDESAVVEAIGESLTHKTPNLEELSGPMRSTTLQKWVPRLTRLRSLAPFHGSSLENTGALLAAHCPTFGWLRFFSWNADDADEIFAKFLTDLHSQSLRSLEIYSLAQLHTKAFTALNNHSASLVELKLGTLESHAIRCLPLLNHCTQLRTLSFSERYQKSVEWEKDHPELIRGLTGWINNCKHLRSLSVTRFGPSLVPILRNEDIRLDHLEVLGYPLADSDDFHIAVGNQANLRSLTLKADTTGSYEERLDTHQSLASSMTQLKDLTYLDLRSSSDAFRDEDVISIAKTHPKLETWWTGGTFITDQVLKPIASMRQLKRLECSAITRFSRKGLEDFFNNLQLPGNDRFNFAVSAPDESEEYDISAEDEEYIKSIAQSRVNGNIEFPARWDGVTPGFDASQSDSD